MIRSKPAPGKRPPPTPAPPIVPPFEFQCNDEAMKTFRAAAELMAEGLPPVAKFCGHCGQRLPPRASAVADSIRGVREPKTFMGHVLNPKALASLKKKIAAVAPEFFQWTEDEFGDWIDSISKEEFIEWINFHGPAMADFLAEHGAKFPE